MKEQEHTMTSKHLIIEKRTGKAKQLLPEKAALQRKPLHEQLDREIDGQKLREMYFTYFK